MRLALDSEFGLRCYVMVLMCLRVVTDAGFYDLDTFVCSTSGQLLEGEINVRRNKMSFGSDKKYE